MRAGLPSVIDPIELAEQGAHLTGSLAVADMPRLQALCRDGGEIIVDLRFERDGRGRRLMHGTVRGRLALTCQRCLEALAFDLRIEPQLILLRPGESAEPVSEETETALIMAPRPLHEIVEDEVLLALPMAPRHAPAACPASTLLNALHAPRANGPFDALAEIQDGRSQL
jgi:uncharacterized protein